MDAWEGVQQAAQTDVLVGQAGGGRAELQPMQVACSAGPAYDWGPAECAIRDRPCKAAAVELNAGSDAHHWAAMRRFLGVQCSGQLSQPQACSLPQLLMGKEAHAAPLRPGFQHLQIKWLG